MKQLSLIEKAFFLKKIELFSPLDLDLLLAISDKMSQDIYDHEECVFSVNQVANRMYLIAEGSVQITFKDFSLKKLEKGAFFGDEALFNENPRTYSAICTSNTLFLTLSRTNLLTIISECPTVAVSLLKCYTKAISCRQSYENT